MPGSNDPSNYTLPQQVRKLLGSSRSSIICLSHPLFLPFQPLHHCLLPRSCRYTESFRLVTNPYEAWVGDRLFLGGSGQIPEDIAAYTEAESKGR